MHGSNECAVRRIFQRLVGFGDGRVRKRGLIGIWLASASCGTAFQVFVTTHW
jgi:hypothetical protein